MLHRRTAMWMDHHRCGGWFRLSLKGGVSLCVDHDAEDYHMAVASNAEPQEVREGLEIAREFCLTLLDEEWDEPVITPSGAVQLYLTSVRWLSSFEVERRSA